MYGACILPTTDLLTLIFFTEDATFMKSNAEINSLVSDLEPKSYKQRLNRWAIAQLMPNKQLVIVARYRSRSDADGHLLFFKQQSPEANFVVIVDKKDTDSD